jgi:hypothetical protein
MKESIVISNVSCAVICAKWALDLGYSPLSQILCLIGGILLGPLMLLALYVRLTRRAQREGPAGAKLTQ